MKPEGRAGTVICDSVVRAVVKLLPVEEASLLFSPSAL